MTTNLDRQELGSLRKARFISNMKKGKLKRQIYVRFCKKCNKTFESFRKYATICPKCFKRNWGLGLYFPEYKEYINLTGGKNGEKTQGKAEEKL